MLILTRKLTQTIVIDTDVKITILGVSGKTVRLGIEAPTDVPIRREELEARPRRRKRMGEPQVV